MSEVTQPNTETLVLRLPGEMVALVEEFRRRQPRIPSKSQAVRALLAAALRLEGGSVAQ